MMQSLLIFPSLWFKQEKTKEFNLIISEKIIIIINNNNNLFRKIKNCSTRTPLPKNHTNENMRLRITKSEKQHIPMLTSSPGLPSGIFIY